MPAGPYASNDILPMNQRPVQRLSGLLGRACRRAATAVRVLGVGFLFSASTVMISGECASVPSGSVYIRKLPGNFMAFLVQTSGGASIVTDPYKLDREMTPDAVTQSHDHEDHTDRSRLAGSYRLFASPGEGRVKGVAIRGIAGVHDKGDTTMTNTVFVFDLEGVRLAHFGSQGELPGERMRKEIGTADILILQVFRNAATKMTVKEGAEAARRLGARIIIPAHCDLDLGPELARELGGSCESVPDGEIVLEANVLQDPGAPRVLVLGNRAASSPWQ